MDSESNSLGQTTTMDVYSSPPLPSTQCSIRGCSRVSSDNSTDTVCDSCRGQPQSAGIKNWMEASTSDSLPSAALPSNHPAPASWSQSIDPRLFSTLAAHLAASSVPMSISELATALLSPPTDQGTRPHLPTHLQSEPGSTASPVVGSNTELMRTDESSREEPEEQLETEANQLRICSVRACKQMVPVGYGYKMCPACRLRYQKYGTTKRAKWKVEREKEKQKAPEDSEAPFQIEDAGNPNTPPATPRPADKTPTPGRTNIESEVPTGVTEQDHTGPTAPTQQPSRPSADELVPSVQPQPLPRMQHQPPSYSKTTLHSSPPSDVSSTPDRVRRPPSNPSATVYLESDPIVNGFSKFRVELFEGELDGRHAEGTVMNASHVMKLGEPPHTGTDLASGSSVSLRRMAVEAHVKDAGGMESRERPSSTDNMTSPKVPVSLTVCHPVTSESEIQAAACSPSQGQLSQNTNDSPSIQPPSTTPLPAPKPKGKRRAKPKVAATSSTTGVPTLDSLSPANTAAPPHPHTGYPAPHPYMYPYYPMYFPPYPGAYQYPYFPMPFAAPPSSPPRTKKRKKAAQVAGVAPTPLPHPVSAYPPGHPGAWAYPTHPPPPPITNPLPQGSTSVSPVDPVERQPPPPPPPTSAAYAVPAPYSLPTLQQPSQGQGPSTPNPLAHAYPHLSGTQPYSGTPLTTLMPVPFFPATALSSAAGVSRRDKGKEAESATKDGVQASCEDSMHVERQQQQHVQMQFNYYHYGVGSSQSPTTPDPHTRRKRRKVDPNYREKMEMFRAQATATAANPDSASYVNAPVLSHNPQQPPAPELNVNSTRTANQAIEKDGESEEEPSTVMVVPLRRCLNKGCARPLPRPDMDGSGNNSTICRKCKTRFKKMTERTKQRFRLVPKQTVWDILGR